MISSAILKNLEGKLIQTKTISITNFRAAGSDENVKIAPKINFSLEECMEYIQGDEYVEITPKTLRLRKVLLNENDRKRAKNAALA